MRFHVDRLVVSIHGLEVLGLVDPLVLLVLIVAHLHHIDWKLTLGWIEGHEQLVQEVKDFLPEAARGVGIVGLKQLFDCAADCLLLVLFVAEMVDYLVEVEIVNYGDACCILHDLLGVMQSKQQRPKRLNSDLP